MNEVVIMVCSMLALILSIITSVFSIISYATVIGLKSSTHKVEWVPMEPEEKLTKGEEKDVRSLHEYVNGDDY